MEAREIFDLIVKADDAIKYATPEKAEAQSRRARELLARARQEALAIGNQALVEQAERRLQDLSGVGRAPPEASGDQEDQSPA